MTDETPIADALDVWRKMQRDPALITGLTFGDVMDLMSGITALLELNEDLIRAIPVATGKEWASLEADDLVGTMNVAEKFVALPEVRAKLNELLDLREKAGM